MRRTSCVNEHVLKNFVIILLKNILNPFTSYNSMAFGTAIGANYQNAQYSGQFNQNLGQNSASPNPNYINPTGPLGGLLEKSSDVCPEISVAKNCIQPELIRTFDIMQKVNLQQKCEAKNCCWDNERFTTNLLKSTMTTNIGQAAIRYNCPWFLPRK